MFNPHERKPGSASSLRAAAIAIRDSSKINAKLNTKLAYTYDFPRPGDPSLIGKLAVSLGAGIGSNASGRVIKHGSNIPVPNRVSGNIFGLGNSLLFGPGTVFNKDNPLGSALTEVFYNGLNSSNLRSSSMALRKHKGLRLLSNKWGTAYIPSVYSDLSDDLFGHKLGNDNMPLGMRLQEMQKLYGGVSSPLAVKPHDFKERLSAAQQYHEGVLRSLYHAGYNPLATKAQLIREAGVVSGISNRQLGWGVTFEEAAKGLHKRLNIIQISKRLAAKNQFVTPVIGGSLMAHEMGRADEIAKIFGVNNDPFISRIQTRNFLAIGQMGANNEILPLSALGDSAGLGSGAYYDLFSDPAASGHKLAGMSIYGQDIKTLNIRGKLRRAVLRHMHGNKGRHIAATNTYMFDKGMRLKGTEALFFEKQLGIPGLAKALGGKGTILGFHDLEAGASLEDALRSVVATNEKHLTVRGFTIQNGALRFLINNPGYGPRNGRFLQPSLIGDKVYNIAAQRGAVFQGKDLAGNLGSQYDIITRLEEAGISIGKNGLEVKERFLLQQYLPKLLSASRNKGKLGSFASTLGLSYHAGSELLDEYVSESSPLVGNTEAKIRQLLGMSDSQLSDIGLSREDLGHMSVGPNGQIQMSKRALQTIEHGGITMVGIEGLSSTAARTQQVGQYNGGMKIRMTDYTPILRQKQAFAGHDKVGGAYGNVIAFIEAMQLKGPKGLNKPGLGAVSSEVASIAHMLGHKLNRGIYKNTQLNQAMTLNEFLQGYRPGAPSLALAEQMVKNRGGISTSALIGTAHEAGRGRKAGVLVDLGFDVEIDAMSRSTQGVKRIRQLAIPSDLFLGTAPTRSKVFFGKRGGYRDLGLGRLKLLMIAGLHEEAESYRAKHGGLSGFKASHKLSKLMSKFATGLDVSLEGKKGILDKTLTYKPKSGRSYVMDGTRGNLNTGQVSMNKQDAIKHLRKSGYRNKRALERMISRGNTGHILAVDRAPLHGTNSLQFMELVIDDALNNGSMGIRNDPQAAKWGDFDWDTSRAWSSITLQKDFRAIHARESAIHGSVYAAQEATRRDLLSKWATAGEFNLNIATDRFLSESGGDLTEAAIKAGIAREAGAGGGAIMTRYPDLFAKNLTRTAELISGNSGDLFLSGLKDQALAGDLRAAVGSGISAPISILRDVMVNAALNKKHPGHLAGSGGVFITEALEEYATNRSPATLAKLEGVLGNTLWESAPSFINPDGSGVMKMDEAMTHMGITTSMTEAEKRIKVMEYASRHAKGIGDIHALHNEIGNMTLEHSVSAYVGEHGMSKKTEMAVRSGRSLIFGDDGSAIHSATSTAAASASGSMRHAAKKAISSTNKTIQQKAANQPGLFQNAINTLQNVNWGSKKVGVAAAVIGGIAAIDSFTDNDPEPPVYMPSNNSSPLPPSVPIDNSMDFQEPVRMSFPSKTRIDRPYQRRSVYNIMADNGDISDFGNLINTRPGRMGQPSHNSYIKDNRNDRDLPYQMRERLKGSF